MQIIQGCIFYNRILQTRLYPHNLQYFSVCSAAGSLRIKASPSQPALLLSQSLQQRSQSAAQVVSRAGILLNVHLGQGHCHGLGQLLIPSALYLSLSAPRLILWVGAHTVQHSIVVPIAKPAQPDTGPCWVLGAQVVNHGGNGGALRPATRGEVDVHIQHLPHGQQLRVASPGPILGSSNEELSHIALDDRAEVVQVIGDVVHSLLAKLAVQLLVPVHCLADGTVEAVPVGDDVEPVPSLLPQVLVLLLHLRQVQSKLLTALRSARWAPACIGTHSALLLLLLPGRGAASGLRLAAAALRGTTAGDQPGLGAGGRRLQRLAVLAEAQAAVAGLLGGRRQRGGLAVPPGLPHALQDALQPGAAARRSRDQLAGGFGSLHEANGHDPLQRPAAADGDLRARAVLRAARRPAAGAGRGAARHHLQAGGEGGHGGGGAAAAASPHGNEAFLGGALGGRARARGVGYARCVRGGGSR